MRITLWLGSAKYAPFKNGSFRTNDLLSGSRVNDPSTRITIDLDSVEKRIATSTPNREEIEAVNAPIWRCYDPGRNLLIRSNKTEEIHYANTMECPDSRQTSTVSQSLWSRCPQRMRQTRNCSKFRTLLLIAGHRLHRPSACLLRWIRCFRW